MLIKITEEQKNNLLKIIDRTTKLPEESTIAFSQVISELMRAIMNPVPEQKPNRPELVINDGDTTGK